MSETTITLHPDSRSAAPVQIEDATAGGPDFSIRRGTLRARNVTAPTACTHPGCSCSSPTTWWTAANAVTAARTLACLVLGMIGLAGADQRLLVIAYFVYVAGDMLDGYVARTLDQETRDGATFDIICDRLCAVPLFLAWVTTEPHTAAAVAIWMVGFAGVDLLLSLSFRAWPIRGVGGFEYVDAALYRWNFTPPVKALNSSVFIAALVFLPTSIPAALIATASLVLKTWSLVRVQRLLPGAAGVTCLQPDGEQRAAA